MNIWWIGSNWHMSQTGPKRQGPYGRASGPSVQVGRQPVDIFFANEEHFNNPTHKSHYPTLSKSERPALSSRSLVPRWIQKDLIIEWLVRLNKKKTTNTYTGCAVLLLSHDRWQEYDWETPWCSLASIPTYNSIDSSPLLDRTTNENWLLRLWLNTPKPGSHQFWYLSHIHVFSDVLSYRY